MTHRLTVWIGSGVLALVVVSGRDLLEQIRLNLSILDEISGKGESPLDLRCGPNHGETPVAKASRAGALTAAFTGDCEKAQQVFEKLVSTGSADRVSLTWLGDIYLALSRKARAVETWSRAGSEPVLYRRAALSWERLDRQETLYWADLVLQALSTPGMALKVARLYRELGHPQRAIEALTKGLNRSQPGQAIHWLIRAYRLELQDDVVGAVTACEKGLIVDPRDRGLRLRALRLLERQGENERALRHARALAEGEPFESQWLVETARLAARLEDFAEMSELLSRARGLKDTVAWELELETAKIYCAAGRLDAALGYFEAAAAGSLHHPDVSYHLAQCYLSQGQFSRVIEHLDQPPSFRGTDQQRVRSLLVLARGHLGAGNVHRAIEACQDVLRLDPGNPIAAARLGRLREAARGTADPSAGRPKSGQP